MTKDEALNLAFAWYGSGNQDPDEFEKLIVSIVEQRTWVGLTNDELTDLFYNENLGQMSAVGQAIELLRERNQ